jgi:hypothetical protein
MAGLLVAGVVACALIHGALAAGAGRAFPVESENFVIAAFRKVSPSIEWDVTNFLVDLSGQYANCNNLHQKGKLTADRTTPEGASITVLVDSAVGNASDITAVHSYITGVIDRWVAGGQHSGLLRESKRFGCSVRPSCSGNAVIACIFTDDKASSKKHNGGHATKDPHGHHTDDPFNVIEPTRFIPDQPNGDKTQKALAFTKEQYDEAERILGKKWDRSHFLEDLSGFETDCEMVGKNDWNFARIKDIARERKVKITGQYGTTPNKGSTPDALKLILGRFKPIPSAKQVGCSVQPGCKSGGTEHVVIACLYEEA